MKRVRLLDPCHFLRYGISVHAHLELADSVQGLTGELGLARGPCRPLGTLSFRCQPVRALVEAAHQHSVDILPDQPPLMRNLPSCLLFYLFPSAKLFRSPNAPRAPKPCYLSDDDIFIFDLSRSLQSFSFTNFTYRFFFLSSIQPLSRRILSLHIFDSPTAACIL
jgi:hypothetical protein